MTPQMCRDLALRLKYRFWATSNRTDCYAGQVDPTYLARSPQNCNARC